MLLGLYFIGLSYLLVYVGAVSILFLFILMLINVRISELLTEGKNSIPLAIIAVLSFNFTVNTVVPYYIYMFDAISNYLLYIYRFLYHKLFLGLNIDMLNLMSRSTDFDLANVKSKS
jgi:NADH-ubiquinone oxidoreductase chain 6